MKPPLRLVLADDHPIVLRGLEQVFRQQPDIAVLGTCETGEQAIELVRKERPDVLVLDLRLPGRNGLDVLRAVASGPDATAVVILTAEIDDIDLLEAVKLGARGILLKDTPPDELVRSVRKVGAGGHALNVEALLKAVADVNRRETVQREFSALLTPREHEIVRLAARGLRNKEIAAQLFISEGTVKLHLHHIYEKLGVGGRVELLLVARAKGLDG